MFCAHTIGENSVLSSALQFPRKKGGVGPDPERGLSKVDTSSGHLESNRGMGGIGNGGE